MSWKPRSAARHAWSRPRHQAVAGIVAGLLVPGLSLAPVRPPAGQSAPAQLRPVPAARPVHVHAVASHRVKVPAMHAWHRPAVSWPAQGTATASPQTTAQAGAKAAGRPAAYLAGASPGSARAGKLPVWVGQVTDARRGGIPAAGTLVPAAVRVRMLPRQAAAAAGIDGVIFTVSRADGQAAAAGVHVSLDYSSFAFADGGDYAGRLHLVTLPACAVTTPRVSSCRRQTPLASADNSRDFRLGADVSLPAATQAQAGMTRAAGAASPGVVLAAAAGSSGSGGDYTATPLSQAGSWQAGGSSGAFTYSYPITVPPVPGGLAPQVSLDYKSQAVDGLTSSTNNQASWVGDGWDYSPGFIERDYQSCEQNPAGPTKTGDECWSSGDTTTLSLNGQDTTLVLDSSTNTWHAKADSNERITFKTGTTNGTHAGDYWVITDAGGTSYYFGLSQLPGYASGDQATNSAWTVPVYATGSGQPCYNSTFSAASCPQAWRWNLDYVTDSHGSAMAYFYNTETNYYAADNGTKATASYVQAGALSRIEYGLRAGAVYGPTPAAQVNFSTVTSRSDVPTSGSGDLACSSGSSCDVVSPTFWGKYQLSTIGTQALEGTKLVPADSWALTQTFPSTGDGSTEPAMWLSSITRTGQDGTPVSLPPATFAGISLPNRVETPADLNDGYSIVARMRLSSVASETGGVTQVSYDSPPPSCTSGNFPAEDTNATLCYPDWWTPQGGSPTQDWFNKYVVTAVTQSNTAGGTTPVATSYCYGASPGCLSGAAWHYNDDPLLKTSKRTWDQWRGFRAVTTQTGTSPDPLTKVTDNYFQGLDGDYQSGGGTRSASLTSSQGDQVTDSDQFAGLDLEHIAYNGTGGSQVTDTITIPWTSAATGSQSQPSPLPALTAFMTGTARKRVYTALTSGGSRESDTTYTHDSSGRVTSESSIPDTGKASQDTCTTTSYAQNTSAWILDLPAEVTVTSVPCTATPQLPANAVSDTRHLYDGATSISADTPTAGNVTQTQLATSYTGSTPAFTTQTTDAYDQYGRITSAADADNQTTATAYTPAAGAEPTSVTVTDPMKLATTTSYDPVRDLPLSVTNPASLVTSQTYDALGRLTAVWKPGHMQGTAPADRTFSYRVSATSPSVITTNTITPSGGYNPAEVLYDSLGRQIETQTQTPDGGRDITDVFYNSDGWPLVKSAPYYATGTPSGTLVAAPDDQVPSQTGYFYDGDGRVVRAVSYKFATQTWETDTTYGGNFATVVPPAGGTAKTTFTDGEGNISAIYQYHASVPADPADPAADYDATSYTYTPAQQLASITDAAGNTWAYGYNLAGDQTSQTDPDAGRTTSGYDAAGQLTSATDARGKQISYSYDADGRKTAEYDTTGGAQPNGASKLAAWTYDTLAKGELTSATTYSGGTSGTAYTQGVTGYSAYGLPSGSDTVISAGPLAGTYKRGYNYGAYGDLMSSYFDAAAGGLPGEQVNTGYDSSSLPVSVGSSLWSYVAALSYTELGQPQQYAFGTTTEPAWLLNTYDQQTGRLTGAQVQAGVSPVTVDSTGYAYDNAGNITSEADTPSGGPAQVQCFQYDYLARMVQAWAQGAAGCAAAPSQSAEGGAAPYWNSYGYNTQNNLTAETATPPSGAAATTRYNYNAPGPGAIQPHAMQSSGPAGSPTTSYSYDADGRTTKIAGPSSTRSMSWNDAGQLSSIDTAGTGAGSTGYVYDATGNLLLQTDPGSVTLYLPDEQVVLNTSTGATSATRFYSIGGVTVAARTSSGQVQYLAGDQHGTDAVAIDSATLAVTRRYYDPNGNAIGTPPASWPGSRGFVGGTADPATSLTNLGAREYDSATAAFISPDSILDSHNPQDLNPYAYAADNPATDSDPTGLMICDGSICASIQYFEQHPNAGGGGAPARPAPTYATPAYYNPYIFDEPTTVAHVFYPVPAVMPPVRIIRNSVRTLSPHQASSGMLDLITPPCGRFLYHACMSASIGVSAVGGAQGSVAALGGVTTKASAAMRAGQSEGGQIMSLLSRNNVWRDAGRLGRSDAFELAGRSLLGAGAVLTGIGVYQQTHNAGVAVADAAGDTAISWGAAYGGAWAGGEIGFAVGGPVGALVGAGVGAIVGAGVSLVASGVFNNVVSDVASWF